MCANLFPHFTSQFELIILLLVAKNSHLIHGMILSLKHIYRIIGGKKEEKKMYLTYKSLFYLGRRFIGLFPLYFSNLYNENYFYNQNNIF